MVKELMFAFSVACLFWSSFYLSEINQSLKILTRVFKEKSEGDNAALINQYKPLVTELEVAASDGNYDPLTKEQTWDLMRRAAEAILKLTGEVK